MKSYNNHRSEEILIFSFFMTLFLVHEIPILGFRYPSLAYAVLVSVLFIFLFLFTPKKLFKLLFPIIIVNIVDLVYSIIDSHSNLINSLIEVSEILQILIYPYAFYYIIRTRNRPLLYYFFILLLLTIITTIITTNIGCYKYPGIIRSVVGFGKESPQYFISLINNIGGFDFIYSLVLYTPIFIFFFKYKNKLRYSMMIGVLSFLTVLVIGQTLLYAEFSLAIVFYILSLILFFMPRILMFKKFLLIISFAVVSFFIMRPVIVEGLINISEKIESSAVSGRIYDLSISLQGEEVDDKSDINSRMERYQKSIDGFIQNPLGIWDHYDSAGGHSFILDTIAEYGVLGVFLLAIMFFSIFRNFVLPYKNKTFYGYILFPFGVSVLLALLNPHVYFDFFTFFTPLCFYVYTKQRDYKLQKKASKMK